MQVQSVERINEKIRGGEIRVCTESELMTALSGSAGGYTAPDVVVVTFACDLRGTSCMILVPVAERGVFTRAKSITLDGIPAFPGPAPNERLGVVDTQLFAEQHSAAAIPVNVSGNDILLKILRNEAVRAQCISVEENVYERSCRLEELEYARLIAYNTELPARKFCSSRYALTCLSTVSVGSKLFVNDGMGIVIGCGTRHRSGAPSLSFSVDIFGMNPSYLDVETGPTSPALTIGIPLPVTSDEVSSSIHDYVQGLARSGYEHSRNEMIIGERIKHSILKGDALLTDSNYRIFAGDLQRQS